MTIGKGMKGVQVYVMDEEGELAGEGVAGEIYIGGAGVGRGYVKGAEETARAYVPDGYGEEAGGRLYRTGDVGRVREGGEIEYLGRGDQQVGGGQVSYFESSVLGRSAPFRKDAFPPYSLVAGRRQ